MRFLAVLLSCFSIAGAVCMAAKARETTAERQANIVTAVVLLAVGIGAGVAVAI